MKLKVYAGCYTLRITTFSASNRYFLFAFCLFVEFDEFLEWHSFILYCELWFGGTVHAKAIELMIRDGVDVWRDVYQDDVTKATSLWR